MNTASVNLKRLRKFVLLLIGANFALILILGLAAVSMGGGNWPWTENGVETVCLDHALNAHSVLVDQQVSSLKLFSQPDLVTCTWHDGGRTVITTFGSWPQTLVQTSLMYLVIWAQYSAIALVLVALASALVWLWQKVRQWNGSRVVSKQ
jgi:hypothetical protein